jgi:hypothetical protein
MACVPGYGTTVQRTTYNERGWAVGGGREKESGAAEKEKEKKRESRELFLFGVFLEFNFSNH